MKRHMAWLGLILIAIVVAADDTPDKSAAPTFAKEQLAKIQGLVGSWRGVGQPQRGSNKGSWIERAAWEWNFGQEGPSLALKLEQGKYFSTAELAAGKKEGEYTLVATAADGQAQHTYRGSRDKEGHLTLTADKPAEGMPSRVSMRLVAGGDRLLVLLERPSPSGSGFVRLAEVGYTRQGSGFGQGGGGPECVVTGGFGSIEVTHNGQKYYVCCSGCRDYFNENPEEVLAEYQARKAEEKKKREEMK